MTPERLAEIRERLEKISPAPWHTAASGPYPYQTNVYTNPEVQRGVVARLYRCDDAYPPYHTVVTQGDLDSAFIASAPTDIADLLAEVERLSRGCETCKYRSELTSSDYKRRWFVCDLADRNCDVMGNRCGAHSPKETP